MLEKGETPGLPEDPETTVTSELMEGRDLVAGMEVPVVLDYQEMLDPKTWLELKGPKDPVECVDLREVRVLQDTGESLEMRGDMDLKDPWV